MHEPRLIHCGHRFTRHECQVLVGHCLSFFTKCNVNLCLPMLFIDSPRQKGQVQSEFMLNNACQTFTKSKRPNAMWIYACQCFSSILPTKKAKYKVNLCWTTLVKHSRSQKGQMQCESMLVNAFHRFSPPKRPSTKWIYAEQRLSNTHEVKKAKCNVNLCLSMFIIDSPGQKGQVQGAEQDCGSNAFKILQCVIYHKEIKVYVTYDVANLHTGSNKPGLINNHLASLISNIFVSFSNVLNAFLCIIFIWN